MNGSPPSDWPARRSSRAAGSKRRAPALPRSDESSALVGQVGESCRVAPPEGVLFTSGGYVALALGRIFEHAACRSEPHCLGDAVNHVERRRRRLYAAKLREEQANPPSSQMLGVARGPPLRGLRRVLRVF